MDTILKTHPAVFAVEDEYQIMVPVQRPTLFWIKVADKCYFDHSCGILRSAVTIHRVRIPKAALDAAGAYTVCCQPMVERKPYYPVTEPLITRDYVFRSVRGPHTVMYQIADAHDMVDEPVAAAKLFEARHGKLDFLLLNGDLTNHSNVLSHFENIYKIASAITAGEIPTVFSRGNHDMRGEFAEQLADITPSADGLTYFKLRFGDIFLLVLDCGEDKPDDNIEYNGTICCHEYRLEETEFLRRTAVQGLYRADGICHVIVALHSPFTLQLTPLHDIEIELYDIWAKLLDSQIKPELMLCGHKHELLFQQKGHDRDKFPHSYPVAIGSYPDHKRKYFAGMGVVFDEDGSTVYFTDNFDATLGEYKTKL